jgi:hypothetical protein
MAAQEFCWVSMCHLEDLCVQLDSLAGVTLLPLKWSLKSDVVVHICKLSTWEEEVGG